MIELALGIIIGLLINPVKKVVEHQVVQKMKQTYQDKFGEKAQFLEPVSLEEKFNSQNNNLDNLK